MLPLHFRHKSAIIKWKRFTPPTTLILDDAPWARRFGLSGGSPTRRVAGFLYSALPLRSSPLSRLAGHRSGALCSFQGARVFTRLLLFALSPQGDALFLLPTRLADR